MHRDSIDTVIELLDKAIELNPDSEKYYLAKGQLYLDYGIIDSAINSLLTYKKYNHTNYTATAGLGMLYHMRGDSSSATLYYQKAMDEYNSKAQDSTDIYTLLAKKELGFFLYGSVNYDDLKQKINSHPDSLVINMSIEMLESENRDTFIDKLKASTESNN